MKFWKFDNYSIFLAKRRRKSAILLFYGLWGAIHKSLPQVVDLIGLYSRISSWLRVSCSFYDR